VYAGQAKMRQRSKEASYVAKKQERSEMNPTNTLAMRLYN
jgi:hypothetical protein